ncbi:uncharacterized protein LOC111688672 [Lucilia cuprina]|uniref:uncharacterized protein LOC111688672 n=1 Tax=Lucilia cuprina TaxID=7375 RepID=UPI001F055D30|nr:uncharacterized protein LOC111688672 [Lucilia cuprina]
MFLRKFTSLRKVLEKSTRNKLETKMKLLTTFTLFTVLVSLTFGADTNPSRFNNKGQYRSDQYYDVKSNNGRYYKNRETYNQRRYYDNFYKKYNPDVQPQEARIVEHIVEPIQEDGSYAYIYETENGIHNEARGTATTLDNGDTAQKVEGSFSFVTPEGIRVGIRYVADENGYRPIITYDGLNAEQFTRSQAAANVEITKV